MYDQAKNSSAQDVARVGTKTVVDMMLLHGAVKIISAIAKPSLASFLSCVRKGAQSVDAAITAEGVPVRCAEEISSLMNSAEQVTGGAVAKAALEMTKEAPELLRAFHIARYDSSIGNLKKLEQAIEKLKDIPGALTKDGALFKVLEYGVKEELLIDAAEMLKIDGRLSTARGAMYEVEKALELIESGEEIVHLGQKINNREFDIITKTKIIECKNIDWSTLIGKSADRMKSNLGQWKSIAKSEAKAFELHSKKIIPQEWKDLLIKMGIHFVENNAL